MRRTKIAACLWWRKTGFVWSLSWVKITKMEAKIFQKKKVTIFFTFIRGKTQFT